MVSTWGEEKYVTILQNKELRVNCEETCFLYRVEKGKMTKTEDTRLCFNHEEADTKMLFHVGHLVAPNNVVVRTADTDILIIALANMEILSAGINIWLEMGLHTNNTLRYMCISEHIAPSTGNSICVALPGFYAFIRSDYTALFNRKGKIRPLKLLEKSEDAKKAFSVLKGPFISDGEIQTTFKAIEKFTCAMYGRKRFTSIEEARLDIFLKKCKPNKNDNVLKENIRKFDGGCLPPRFRVLQKKIC